MLLPKFFQTLLKAWPIGQFMLAPLSSSRLKHSYGKHASYTIDEKNVAVIRLDSPGSKVNTINTEVMQELRGILDEIQAKDSVKGAVLISGKPGCFITGADIKMLEQCKTVSEVAVLSKESQDFFTHMEQCKKPLVAAIMGPCLGGGLVTALACHYRVAVNGRNTILGYPEVLLGLLPGSGGTQRLLKLVSIPTALDICLTGKSMSASKARGLGLVDAVVEPLGPGLASAAEATHNHIETVAANIAADLANGNLKIPVRGQPRTHKDKLLKFLLRFEFFKNFIFSKAERKVMQQTHGLYPAPLKILEVIRAIVDCPTSVGHRSEHEAFGELCATPESKALISLFLAQAECKKNRFGAPLKRAETICILGAGSIGTRIAQLCIDKGIRTILKDPNPECLSQSVDRLQKAIQANVKRKRIPRLQGERIMAHMKYTTDSEKLHNVDMVIETGSEDFEIKCAAIKEIEKHVPEDCVIALNASAMPITPIATVSRRPDKVIGKHYLSPVNQNQLLEVITTKDTSEDTAAAAVDVGLRQGKVVILVRDRPGFYTTRVMAPALTEVVKMLQEGVEPNRIDKLCKKFGFSVSLCSMLDEVGIDVAARTAQHLGEAFGERIGGSSPEVLKQMIKSGFLGRKSGKGCYLYSKDKKHEPEVNQEAMDIFKRFPIASQGLNSDADIQLRLVMRFVNEAVRCLQEGTIASPQEADVGAVLGLGFPAMRGGPFRFVSVFGVDKIVATMRRFEEKYGAPFTPCDMLIEMVKTGEKFYH